MKPFKPTVQAISNPEQVGSKQENAKEQEIYVEMKPATLYPAPNCPAPIYAPVMPSSLTTTEPKQNWEESSSDSLYYASRDLLAAKRS